MNKSTVIKIAASSASTLALLAYTGSSFTVTAAAPTPNTLNLSAPTAAGNVVSDPSVIIRFAINGLIIVGIVAALLFLLYGGIRWILSGGDKAKVDTARNTIVAAIVGLIIVILAWVIINTVVKLLTGCDLGNFQLPTLGQEAASGPCAKAN